MRSLLLQARPHSDRHKHFPNKLSLFYPLISPLHSLPPFPDLANLGRENIAEFTKDIPLYNLISSEIILQINTNRKRIKVSIFFYP